MKAFAHSLLLYVCVQALAVLAVFPLYPSSIPVLMLLLGSCIWIFRPMGRIPASDDSGPHGSGGVAGRVLKKAFLCLALVCASLVILLLSTTPLGPLVVAVSLLFYFTLTVSEKRVSIFAGGLIYVLLWAIAYLVFEWHAGFLSTAMAGVIGSLGVVSCALVRTFSVSGMEEGERRPMWRSLFPVREAWARKGATLLLGGLLFTNGLLFNATYVNTGKKMDKARKESSMLERKLRMARVRAKNLPKLKAEIRKVAAQLQEGGRLLGLESEHKKWITQTTGNAEKQGLVVTASQYRELGKRRWHRVGYVLPVQHRIRVKGKRDAVWEFMTANLFCPGGGSIREFHMVNGGAGAVAADVQWKGYTCSPRWRKTKRRKR